MSAVRGLSRAINIPHGKPPLGIPLASTNRRRPPSTPAPFLEYVRKPASAPTENTTSHLKLLDTLSDWQVQEIQWSGRNRQGGTASALLLTHPGRHSPVVLSTAWLRDACTCPLCVDPHSGQKNFGTSQVYKNPIVGDAVKTESGGLRVTWHKDHLNNDTHVSEYPAERVKEWVIPPSRRTLTPTGSQGMPELWDAKLLAARDPFYSYDAFMAGGDDYLTALDSLRLYGLFFLRGVPKNETAVEDIAAKLGIIQETFYGRTWDVRSKPKAENVAYTSSFLGLHQDLLYMRNVPKLQILHCLENDTAGGEALFSDGGRAASLLRFTSPHLGSVLDEKKTIFRYDKGDFEFQHARSAISLSPRSIFWSPPFQKPEQDSFNQSNAGARDYQEWGLATRRLQSLIESPEYVFEYRYRPGDCVVFDNTRLLHGRKQFDSASGARWLKGTYVDLDSYLNTLYQAAKRRDPEEPSRDPLKAVQEYAVPWFKARATDKRRKDREMFKREAESREATTAEGAGASFTQQSSWS